MIKGAVRLVAISLAAGLVAFSGVTPAPATDQALIDAAKKEGQVTWYTTLIVDQFVRPAVAAFEKKYGINVNFIRADGSEVALRIFNEGKASHMLADIFSGSDVAGLVKAGYVKRWLPDETLHFPKEYYDPAGFWAASNIYVMTPGYNTDLVPRGTEPKSFEDLLDPKWQGKIAWASNPSSPAGAAGFIGSALTAMGEEKGLAYLQKLAKQKIVSLGVSAREVLNEVIVGEYPIALQIFNHQAAISAARGASVDWSRFEPAMVYLQMLAVTEGSPHPNAGKLLFDFLESEEGQILFRNADYLPADPNVPPRDPTLTPMGSHSRAITLSPETLDPGAPNSPMPHWNEVYHRLFE